MGLIPLKLTRERTLEMTDFKDLSLQAQNLVLAHIRGEKVRIEADPANKIYVEEKNIFLVELANSLEQSNKKAPPAAPGTIEWLYENYPVESFNREADPAYLKEAQLTYGKYIQTLQERITARQAADDFSDSTMQAVEVLKDLLQVVDFLNLLNLSTRI